MGGASGKGVQRRTILGCPVDAVTMDQAVRHIEAFIAEGTPHQVVTVNPEFVMRARVDPEFRRVLQEADLATADGAGLLLAARLLGFRVPGRVTGVDLVHRLATSASVHGWRIFLLGAGPGIARRAASALQRDHPRLAIAGAYAGSPDIADYEEIRSWVGHAEPHALLVAFGAPAQDVWIGRHQSSLRVPVAIGVGGAFDVLAGAKRRAPPLLQRSGLEWAYRLRQEPWRWRRMLALPAFTAQVARLALTQRCRR